VLARHAAALDEAYAALEGANPDGLPLVVRP
jgi:hypothetical protein